MKSKKVFFEITIQSTLIFLKFLFLIDCCNIVATLFLSQVVKKNLKKSWVQFAIRTPVLFKLVTPVDFEVNQSNR